ncbi:hypothetical protein, partial [Bradyrhizobium sp. Leo170]|uniref:hypothetical protein n=1 Tax=Bradyrhizobium sp. Leo170 TaxID=1571199 RepID=UPI001A91A41E
MASLTHRMSPEQRFSRNIKVICLVQSAREKHSASFWPQITLETAPSRLHLEGRIAIVTDVGSGMRWTWLCQARIAPDEWRGCVRRS